MKLIPGVQEKLQEEVDSAFDNDEEIDNLEAINSLEYLEQVILESSRRYTANPVLFRQCTKEYRLPGTDITIKKGWEVCIFPPGLHMDPDIYPEPEQFDPSRFTREERAARHPMAFQAFGQGPRYCIGKAFAMLGTRGNCTICNFFCCRNTGPFKVPNVIRHLLI